MIRNYLKTAIRSLVNNKAFTFINVFGLVLGISFSTMLYVYVSHELSYDSFHAKSERTYRVLTTDKSNPSEFRTYAISVPALGPELVNTFPEVEETVRLYKFSGQVIVETGEEKYNERNWFTTSDVNFFDVFDFEFIEGEKTKALLHPLSAVLTSSTARKYFGEENALGKTINLTGIGTANITGVIKDIPKNSHLQFDLLLSPLRTGPDWDNYLNSWERFGAGTYIVLREGAHIRNIEAKVPALMEKHLGAEAKLQATAFQPIEDIYLHSSEIEAGAEQQRGELSYVYIFSSMAVFLLFLAAINYINLSTSKAASRAKEIGVRKTAGAARKQLIAQFLVEAFLITLIAMLLSLVAMNLCFPLFNEITGKDFELTFNNVGDYLPTLLAITLLIGLLAGTYPAFHLSKLKPVVTLKGHHTVSKSSFDLRTALVIFQFTVSITLIVSTFIIGKQLDFIQTKDIGFEKEGLMIIDINSGKVREQFQAMKNEFLKLPGVNHVAVSSRVPGEWKNIREVFVRNSQNADSLQSYFMGFDEDMLKTYQLQLSEGTYFTGNNPADSSNVLINKSAARTLNLTEPVGATLRIGSGSDEWIARVVGVLEDFNFQSLHQKVAPMIIGYRNNPIQAIDYFTLRVSGNINDIIRGATGVHEKFDTNTPIEYHFLTDQLDSFYVSEQKAGMIFRMAGVLSMIVACLGLLGLVTYHLERKTKELGIRKILGAGYASLFMIVFRAFAKQVGVAFVLACPIAWFIMREWLGSFEYRISPGAGIFVLAGVVVLVTVTFTVSFHGIKAARFNPVDLLRND